MRISTTAIPTQMMTTSLSSQMATQYRLDYSKLWTQSPAVGNVLDNDTGVDAPLSLASVSFGSDSHNFATDGNTATFTLSNTAGDYGTVEIDSDGAYRFLVTELLIVLETTVIDYVAQDSDGDSDAATLTLQAAPRVEVASNSRWQRVD